MLFLFIAVGCEVASQKYDHEELVDFANCSIGICINGRVEMLWNATIQGISVNLLKINGAFEQKLTRGFSNDNPCLCLGLYRLG